MTTSILRTSFFRQANDIGTAPSSKITHSSNVVLLVMELLVGRQPNSSIALGIWVGRVAGVQTLLNAIRVGDVGVLERFGRSARGERIGVGYTTAPLAEGYNDGETMRGNVPRSSAGRAWSASLLVSISPTPPT